MGDEREVAEWSDLCATKSTNTQPNNRPETLSGNYLRRLPKQALRNLDFSQQQQQYFFHVTHKCLFTNNSHF